RLAIGPGVETERTHRSPLSEESSCESTLELVGERATPQPIESGTPWGARTRPTWPPTGAPAPDFGGDGVRSRFYNASGRAPGRRPDASHTDRDGPPDDLHGGGAGPPPPRQRMEADASRSDA